jgi:hypothetical protein
MWLYYVALEHIINCAVSREEGRDQEWKIGEQRRGARAREWLASENGQANGRNYEPDNEQGTDQERA